MSTAPPRAQPEHFAETPVLKSAPKRVRSGRNCGRFWQAVRYRRCKHRCKNWVAPGGHRIWTNSTAWMRRSPARCRNRPAKMLVQRLPEVGTLLDPRVVFAAGTVVPGIFFGPCKFLLTNPPFLNQT